MVEAVGRPGEPRVEVLRVAYAKGFADVFPESGEAEAREVPDHVRDEDRRGRRDLHRLPLVTIDGEDARDFDDAVYVERLPARKGKAALAAGGGHRRRRPLRAARAPRSTPRRCGAAPASTSRCRCCPMLPERLSNGICSLNPDVDRLCMVADMVVDATRRDARPTEVYEAVMRSAARCTYTEVARVLDGEQVPERERFRPSVRADGGAAGRSSPRCARRRGAIDFDLPEAKIVLGRRGRRGRGIEKRPRNRAHRIVEEFMLAANEAVARLFGARELPTIYRVHGVPGRGEARSFLALARDPRLRGARARRPTRGR